MRRAERLLIKAIQAPAGLRFSELHRLAQALGFSRIRVSGSHHTYHHPQICDMLNIQEVKGMAKPYQVRPLLALTDRY